jgi:hypothetical protein
MFVERGAQLDLTVWYEPFHKAMGEDVQRVIGPLPQRKGVTVRMYDMSIRLRPRWLLGIAEGIAVLRSVSLANMAVSRDPESARQGFCFVTAPGTSPPFGMAGLTRLWSVGRRRASSVVVAVANCSMSLLKTWHLARCWTHRAGTFTAAERNYVTVLPQVERG